MARYGTHYGAPWIGAACGTPGRRILLSRRVAYVTCERCLASPAYRRAADPVPAGAVPAYVVTHDDYAGAYRSDPFGWDPTYGDVHNGDAERFAAERLLAALRFDGTREGR